MGDDAGGDGAATDDGGGTAACTPVDGSMPISTLDGGMAWGCLQATCMTELGACAGNCECNNAVLGALLCVAAKGANPTAAQQQACFTPALGMVTDMTILTPLVSCLTGKGAMTCGTAGGDAGDAATSDAPASDAPASDAPASDAPASDAPSEGSSGDSATDAPTG